MFGAGDCDCHVTQQTHPKSVGHPERGGSAHTPNLLSGKDPGNLRDARNSLSPVVNHRVLDECTNVRWLGSYIVSLVVYMCIL